MYLYGAEPVPSGGILAFSNTRRDEHADQVGASCHSGAHAPSAVVVHIPRAARLEHEAEPVGAVLDSDLGHLRIAHAADLHDHVLVSDAVRAAATMAAHASRGEAARNSASPTSTASAPSATSRAASAGVRTPDSAMHTTPSG